MEQVFWCPGTAASAHKMARGSINARQVIVISVDRLTPIEYEDSAAHGLKIPNLTALRTAGCASPGVIAAFPTSSYPNRTAMITFCACAVWRSQQQAHRSVLRRAGSRERTIACARFIMVGEFRV